MSYLYHTYDIYAYFYYLCMVNNATIMVKRNIKRLSVPMFKEIIDSTDDDAGAKPDFRKGYVLAKSMARGMREAMSDDAPLRLDGLRIGLITNGEADVIINLVQHHITAGTLVMLGNETIFQMQRLSADFNLMGIIVYDGTLKEIMHGNVPVVLETQMCDREIALTEEEQAVFMGMTGLLYDIAHTKGDTRSTEYDIVSAILHFYESTASRASAANKGKGTREREIFDLFIRLVNSSAGTHRQLSYYADKLCISQRYLGMVIRTFSGITAKEWIDRAVITEIKVLLKHTSLQISQISDRMDFPNSSFFCKYFKRLTGLTPLEYKVK